MRIGNATIPEISQPQTLPTSSKPDKESDNVKAACGISNATCIRKERFSAIAPFKVMAVRWCSPPSLRCDPRCPLHTGSESHVTGRTSPAEPVIMTRFLQDVIVMPDPLPPPRFHKDFLQFLKTLKGRRSRAEAPDREVKIWSNKSWRSSILPQITVICWFWHCISEYKIRVLRSKLLFCFLVS